MGTDTDTELAGGLEMVMGGMTTLMSCDWVRADTEIGEMLEDIGTFYMSN